MLALDYVGLAVVKDYVGLAVRDVDQCFSLMVGVTRFIWSFPAHKHKRKLDP